MNKVAKGVLEKKLENALAKKYKQLKLISSAGSTALVYSVIQKDLNIMRAVKLLRDENYAQLFMREVNNMARLTHENIISILETGSITLKEAGGKKVIPYFVMEFVEGVQELGKFLHEKEKSLNKETILALFKQILHGLEYIHGSGILHLDIKEENIFVGRGNHIKIADFGFSKRVTKKDINKLSKIRGTYMNWPNIITDNFQVDKTSNIARAFVEIPKSMLTEMLDIHALGKLFERSLRQKKIAVKFKNPDLEYLHLMVSRMDADSKKGDMYSSVTEIQDDLAKLEKYSVPLAGIPELSFIPKKGIIRIPEMKGIPFTERVKEIVDHPWFQRLRNAKQMGFAYLVYPGAVHSRFEHSLGVYYNSIQYMTSLLSDPRTPYFKQVVTEEEILSVLAAALLHDIGQHTFAHSMEEMASLSKPHEHYAQQILTGKVENLLSTLPKPKKTFLDILEKNWHITDPRLVLYIISKGKITSRSLPAHKRILRSIVDGPMDADKMDYLERDSLHAGVPYGRSLDQSRFLQSLTVDDQKLEGIAFSEKGRICAELFFLSRSHMFAEVYWHHGVRAFSGMLNLAAGEYIRSQQRKGQTTKEFERAIFTRPEWDVVSFLFEKGPKSTHDIIDCIRRRVPYKRLHVLKETKKGLYETLGKIRDRSPEIFHQFSNMLVKQINKEFNKHYPFHYFFLDVPSSSKNQLGTMFIIDEESSSPVDFCEKSALWKGTEEDWHRWVRKVRLFCHPKVYQEFLLLGNSYHTALNDNIESLCAEEVFEF
jgi:HD superfamily phosphohydrolase